MWGIRVILCWLVVATGCMSGLHALSLPGNRKLMGLFDGWRKDVSKPNYTRETTFHGIGGGKTVEKTATYTGSTQDETGVKASYTSTVTGSASGSGSTTSVSIVSATVNCRDEFEGAPVGIDCLKTDVSAVGTESVSATINQDQAYQGPTGDATASVDLSGSLDSDGSVLNSVDAFALTAATGDENGGVAVAIGDATYTGDVTNAQTSITTQTSVTDKT